MQNLINIEQQIENDPWVLVTEANNPGILQAREDCFAWEEVAATMQRLAGWVSSGDEASVRAMLQHYVAGFEDAGH